MLNNVILFCAGINIRHEPEMFKGISMRERERVPETGRQVKGGEADRKKNGPQERQKIDGT